MATCNEIGERIRELREGKGITQAELAKALSISKRETISQWEAGTRDLKTDYTIKLADYFEVTCDYILRGLKAENVDINKRLGLSDEAIDRIKEFNKRENNEYDIIDTELFNRVLEDDDFYQLIIELTFLIEDTDRFLRYGAEKDDSKTFKLQIDKANQLLGGTPYVVAHTFWTVEAMKYNIEDHFKSIYSKIIDDAITNKLINKAKHSIK